MGTEQTRRQHEDHRVCRAYLCQTAGETSQWDIYIRVVINAFLALYPHPVVFEIGRWSMGAWVSGEQLLHHDKIEF